MLTAKNKNIKKSPKKIITYIIFIFYLFLLSMNAALIMTGGDWILINTLAVISIGTGIWYAT
jgi:hypothetical protein